MASGATSSSPASSSSKGTTYTGKYGTYKNYQGRVVVPEGKNYVGKVSGMRSSTVVTTGSGAGRVSTVVTPIEEQVVKVPMRDRSTGIVKDRFATVETALREGVSVNRVQRALGMETARVTDVRMQGQVKVNGREVPLAEDLARMQEQGQANVAAKQQTNFEQQLAQARQQVTEQYRQNQMQQDIAATKDYLLAKQDALRQGLKEHITTTGKGENIEFYNPVAKSSYIYQQPEGTPLSFYKEYVPQNMSVVYPKANPIVTVFKSETTTATTTAPTTPPSFIKPTPLVTKAQALFVLGGVTKEAQNIMNPSRVAKYGNKVLNVIETAQQKERIGRYVNVTPDINNALVTYTTGERQIPGITPSNMFAFNIPTKNNTAIYTKGERSIPGISSVPPKSIPMLHTPTTTNFIFGTRTTKLSNTRFVENYFHGKEIAYGAGEMITGIGGSLYRGTKELIYYSPLLELSKDIKQPSSSYKETYSYKKAKSLALNPDVQNVGVGIGLALAPPAAGMIAGGYFTGKQALITLENRTPRSLGELLVVGILSFIGGKSKAEAAKVLKKAAGQEPPTLMISEYGNPDITSYPSQRVTTKGRTAFFNEASNMPISGVLKPDYPSTVYDIRYPASNPKTIMSVKEALGKMRTTDELFGYIAPDGTQYTTQQVIMNKGLKKNTYFIKTEIKVGGERTTRVIKGNKVIGKFADVVPPESNILATKPTLISSLDKTYISAPEIRAETSGRVYAQELVAKELPKAQWFKKTYFQRGIGGVSVTENLGVATTKPMRVTRLNKPFEVDLGTGAVNAASVDVQIGKTTYVFSKEFVRPKRYVMKVTPESVVELSPARSATRQVIEKRSQYIISQRSQPSLAKTKAGEAVIGAKIAGMNIKALPSAIRESVPSVKDIGVNLQSAKQAVGETTTMLGKVIKAKARIEARNTVNALDKFFKSKRGQASVGVSQGLENLIVGETKPRFVSNVVEVQRPAEFKVSAEEVIFRGGHARPDVAVEIKPTKLGLKAAGEQSALIVSPTKVSKERLALIPMVTTRTIDKSIILTKPMTGLKPAIKTKPETKSISETIIKQAQKPVQVQKPIAETKTELIPKLVQTPIITTRITTRQVPVSTPVFTPNIPVSVITRVPKETKSKYKKEVELGKKGKGFIALLKRRGKFSKVSPVVSREAALDIGAMASKRSLGATFKIEEASGVPISGLETGYYGRTAPSFRTYKVVKGRPVALVNTFIEKRGTRLSTPQERTEIRIAKRTSPKGFKNRFLR